MRVPLALFICPTPRLIARFLSRKYPIPVCVGLQDAGAGEGADGDADVRSVRM
jgi:hypothetical protein